MAELSALKVYLFPYMGIACSMDYTSEKLCTRLHDKYDVRMCPVVSLQSLTFLTLSASNFRRHLSSAFYFILTNYRLERRLYVKLKD